ncbi:MAG: energy transducer TonB [Gammaproteobacteria bacterium]|nr:energy transducer TonB [Gammaproteobacteria bacterium]MBU1415078.1 energy transducer TonB [Gammaproteobacteria bacterium]
MRLIRALAISIGIHTGLFALPAGRFFHDASSRTRGPAQLQVELAITPRPPSASDITPTPVASAHELDGKPTVEQGRRPDNETSSPTGEEADGFGLPVPYYFTAGEVSERAKPVREIDLDPPEMRTLPGDGNLRLTLWINEGGTVDRIEVESSGVAEPMEKAITEQFRQATFAPARLDGEAVKSRMKIEVVVRPPVAYDASPPSPSPSSASAVGN